MVPEDQIERAAEAIVRARYPIALTGAGMSVESGIPPFRGPGGLWTKYGEPPMNGFQIFMSNPRKGWEDRIKPRYEELWGPLRAAKPNPGHYALAEIGENRRAALSDYAERRRPASPGGQPGAGRNSRQFQIDPMPGMQRALLRKEISLEVLPPACPRCKGLLKSDTVSFGEPIPTDVLRQCADHSARADLVIVAGTSATVYPAAGFALEVQQRGGTLIEVNLYESEITTICDHSLRGTSAETLPKLAKAVAQRRKESLS